MVVLNIYSLDDIKHENVIASLSRGTHVIGRGGLLEVKDKRVSRNHAVIEVLDSGATLTSVHHNPCFFRAASGKKISILNNGQTNELLDGDQFSLLPDAYWFKTKLELDNITTEDELNELSGCNNSRILKRQKDTHADITNFKKPRLDTTLESEDSEEHIEKVLKDSEFGVSTEANHETKEVSNENLEDAIVNDQNFDSTFGANNDEIDNGIGTNSENITSQEVKNEPISPDTSLDNSIVSPLRHIEETLPLVESSVDPPVNNGMELNQEKNEETKVKIEPDNEDVKPKLVKQETVDDNEQNSQSFPSGSGLSGRRDRCWYGPTCYRRNPNHRDLFSHPGDADYDSDPNDGRPNCPYGNACYRQNIDHRREYKHTSKPAAKPNSSQSTPHTAKNLRKLKNKKQIMYNDSFEDDYDLDDPFICDDSSDEYQCSENSDSEWDDSQEITEDSRERKQLMREAKKFTKGK